MPPSVLSQVIEAGGSKSEFDLRSIKLILPHRSNRKQPWLGYAHLPRLLSPSATRACGELITATLKLRRLARHPQRMLRGPSLHGLQYCRVGSTVGSGRRPQTACLAVHGLAAGPVGLSLPQICGAGWHEGDRIRRRQQPEASRSAGCVVRATLTACTAAEQTSLRGGTTSLPPNLTCLAEASPCRTRLCCASPYMSVRRPCWRADTVRSIMNVQKKEQSPSYHADFQLIDPKLGDFVVLSPQMLESECKPVLRACSALRVRCTVCNELPSKSAGPYLRSSSIASQAVEQQREGDVSLLHRPPERPRQRLQVP